MTRSLLHGFHAFLFSTLIITVSFAQDPARIAYVNSSRTAILAKTLGGKLDTIFTSGYGNTNGAPNSTKVRNLSVLASTRDGKALLIGGYFIFPDPASGLPDSAAVIARIDAPFTNKFGKNGFSNPITIGNAKILKIIYEPEANYTKSLPLGVITSDANEWYGVWDKSQGGNGKLWYFHGKFDGTGTVDSMQLSGSNAPGGGYHLSNLTISPDNKTMLNIVFDQITSDYGRCQLINWTPTSGTFVPTQIDALIHGIQKGAIDNPDWAFGFYLNVRPVETPGIISAEFALDPSNSGDLDMYKIRVQNSSVLDLTKSGRVMKRANIPLLHGTDQLHFFTGNTGNPGSDFDEKEVIVPDSGSPFGNGGDLMPSFGGDSVVFITCQKDNFASNTASGIYIYDLNTSEVYPVFNDETRMERQPIFMGGVVKVTPPPYKVGKAIVDKTSVDFGTVDIGKNKSIQVILTDTTSSLVKVTSAAISGADASQFTVTSTPSVPTTINGHGTLTFDVKFTPSAAKLNNAVLTIHYQDSLQKGENDSIFSIPLTGTGNQAGGVAIAAPASFDLSIAPNPFTASTTIKISARNGGATSFEVRDLLGKSIYSSRNLKLGAGENYSYTLDAASMQLSPGVYMVVVRSGNEEAARQVIYVK
ncbi:MAG: choice-of-anchor D domain-containing protein [Ignavibacteriota bacterium]